MPLSLEKITYRFVPMGQVAPEPLPEGEVWVDVGSRARERVIDHHGGDTDAWSAARLVQENGRALADQLAEQSRVTLVTHCRPDLDAVAAVWLFRRMLTGDDSGGDRQAMDEIVEAVSLNDQGMVRTANPARCWPVVMRLNLQTAAPVEDDLARLLAGFDLMDQTVSMLHAGTTLADAARRLASPAATALISQAERDYLEDRSRAMTFQVRLPVRQTLVDDDAVSGESGQDIPNGDATRWSLCDAIYLDNPRSALFKEMARADRRHSPMRLGYPLMVVSRCESAGADAMPYRYRHTISTDPLSGLHLQGLAALLEETEQNAETSLGHALPAGRERVGLGKGRFGSNVASPWYNGCGHGFTIIDSPVVTIGGEARCLSCLTPSQVLEVVWRYGDPAGFVTPHKCNIFTFQRVTLEDGWEKQWNQLTPIAGICPDLNYRVLKSLVNLGLGSFYSRPLLRAPEDDDSQKTYLWPLGKQLGVLIRQHRYWKQKATLRNLLEDLRQVRSQHTEAPPANSALHLSGINPLFHFVGFDIQSDQMSFEDPGGADAMSLYRVAAADAPSFADMPQATELSSMMRLLSRNHEELVCATESGAVAVRANGVDDDKDPLSPLAYVAGMLQAMTYFLDQLADDFTRHRGEKNPVRAGRQILADRIRLMRFEQELMFPQVSHNMLVQRFYRKMTILLGIGARFSDLKAKVEQLTSSVRDAKADYYHKIAFWVSVLFAPLALTAGIFSGTHLDRAFAQKYVPFLGQGEGYGGWLLFAALFAAVSSGLGLLWLCVKRVYMKNNPMRRDEDKGL